MSPELIADYLCTCGENPLWHPAEKRVYWTDIPCGLMFRYAPANGVHEQFFEGAVVGGFTIQADDALLLFMARGAVKIWRDGELTTVIPEIPGEEDSRFNDVIADPEGRVFAGTMSSETHKGRLYRVDPDGSYTLVLSEIGCSNGMGFTPDGTQMYYTDSAARRIFIFDYDRATGALSNQRIFVEVPPGQGVPDGLTVDAAGDVWSARWGGAGVVHYTPDGHEAGRIELPANQVSSVIFGGDNLRDLYVTTAGGNDKTANGPGAGALFRVPMPVAGAPEFRSRVALG